MERWQPLAERLIREALQQGGGKPVLEIHIAVARCSQVNPEMLRFYLDQAAVGTACQGARIYLREVPFIQECPSCGTRFAARTQHAACPACRTQHTATLLGDDCALVESVKVYQDHPAPPVNAAL